MMWKRSKICTAWDAFFGDDLQIGAPHVGADELERSTSFLAKPMKELEQRFNSTLVAHPQESLTVLVNLIDHGEKVRAVMPLDFIDANGLDVI